ncbi:MAG: hypothetical protein SP1CHLAM54_03810 [Chlamydiia bacterium]|nr:hypothetical protein [Chlamydiia bacterium]MCH9615296.1 hypothetical protein [Chlamydiia bacterium]MCH9628382.1 hypothetical protein [Chlamydiia bacterium]
MLTTLSTLPDLSLGFKLEQDGNLVKIQMVEGLDLNRRVGVVFCRLIYAPPHTALLIRRYAVDKPSLHDAMIEALFRATVILGIAGHLIGDTYFNTGFAPKQSTYAFQSFEPKELWPDLVVDDEAGKAFGLAIDYRQSIESGLHKGETTAIAAELTKDHAEWLGKVTAHATSAIGRTPRNLRETLIWGLYCDTRGDITLPAQARRYYLAPKGFTALKKLPGNKSALPAHCPPMFTLLMSQPGHRVFAYHADATTINVVETTTRASVGTMNIEIDGVRRCLQITSLQMQDGMSFAAPCMLEAAYRVSCANAQGGRLSLCLPSTFPRHFPTALGFTPKETTTRPDLAADTEALLAARTYQDKPTFEHGKHLRDKHLEWITKAQEYAKASTGRETWNLTEILRQGLDLTIWTIRSETLAALQGRVMLRETFDGKALGATLYDTKVEVFDIVEDISLAYCTLTTTKSGAFLISEVSAPTALRKALIEAAFRASGGSSKLLVEPTALIGPDSLKQLGFIRPRPIPHPDLASNATAFGLALHYKDTNDKTALQKLLKEHPEWYAKAEAITKARLKRPEVDLMQIAQHGLVLQPPTTYHLSGEAYKKLSTATSPHPSHRSIFT